MCLFLQFLSTFCCSGRCRKGPKNFATCVISQIRKFRTIAKFRNRPVAGCTEEATEEDKIRNNKVQVKKKNLIYIYISFSKK